MIISKKKMQKKWRNSGESKLPFFKAIFYIFLSTLFISGTVVVGFLFYQNHSRQKKSDSKYNMIAIVQSAVGPERLQTVYLSELLNLSIDKPQNLYSFSLKDAEKKLLSFPLIKKVSLNKIIPGTLFINYTIRIPIAYLGDYSNTAIDNEGILIPFKPFFSPKKVPTIFLGSDAFSICHHLSLWGQKIDAQKRQIAFDIIKFFETKVDLFLEQIDLSRLNSDSYGRREIIIQLSKKNEADQALTVRLNAQNYIHSLKLFETIKSMLNGQEKVLDLRLDRLGLIS